MADPGRVGRNDGFQPTHRLSPLSVGGDECTASCMSVLMGAVAQLPGASETSESRLPLVVMRGALACVRRETGKKQRGGTTAMATARESLLVQLIVMMVAAQRHAAFDANQPAWDAQTACDIIWAALRLRITAKRVY